MRGTKRGAALAACLSGFALAASAQEVLHTFQGGGSAGSGLGQAVRAAGDVDGDGAADVIAGYRNGSSAAGVKAGTARVWSGKSGALLFTFVGDEAGDLLGHAVDGAGDVDGDGHADLIVGAAGCDVNGVDSGVARVHSGADGALLYAIPGPFAKARFGWAVAGLGDVDGDGRSDFAVSGQPDPFTPQPIGFVRVYSGASGALVRELVGPTSLSRLGAALAAAGDVDGDGVGDLVAGDWRDGSVGNASGAVRVYSGADGAQLLALLGGKAGDRMGLVVDGAGDVDGDGHADVIAGSPFVDGAMFDVGEVRVWSGADGSLLFLLQGDYALDFFGAAVAGVGDVDGDGVDDFAVGAYADDDGGANAGRARVYSGFDASLQFELDGDSPADELGYALAGLGDTDGDGGLDFAVGAPLDDAGGGAVSGSVRVYAGLPPPASGLVQSYCVTTPNSVGPGAVLGWTGTTSVAASDLVLTLSGAPPRSPTLFYYGKDALQLPLFGGVLCIDPPLQRLPPVRLTGLDGSTALTVGAGSHRPHLAALRPGTTWNFQAAYLDRDGGPGRKVRFSDALTATFVP